MTQSQIIINDQLYDIENSIQLCEYSEYSQSKSNCTALWKTEKGNYFFEGTFGLAECTKDEAKEFFKENIDGVKNLYSDYAEEFGDEIERA